MKGDLKESPFFSFGRLFSIAAIIPIAMVVKLWLLPP
jgi:hypothetical protein